MSADMQVKETIQPAGAAHQARPTRPRRAGSVMQPVRRFPKHLVLIVVCAIWAIPAIGLLVTSFRTPGEDATSGWWTSLLHPAFIPGNYSAANSMLGIGNTLLNSLAISIPTTIGTVVASAAGAYALARMRFRGRALLLMLIVALLVVPPQVTLVPMLRLFDTLGLIGNTASVSIYQVGFTVPFGIFLLYGFFASLPAEMLEAARMDGASEAAVFFRIAVPTSAPVLAALAMLQFIWSWNDLLTPLLFLSSNSQAAPFTVRIAGMVQSTGQGQETLAAAAIISVILPVAVLIFLQRYFIRGILSGAVKG